MTTTPLPPPGKPLAPLLKVAHVARILSVSRHTVKALVLGGDLEGQSINPSRGRKRCAREHLRITRTSLETFYKKRFKQDLNLTESSPFSR